MASQLLTNIEFELKPTVNSNGVRSLFVTLSSIGEVVSGATSSLAAKRDKDVELETEMLLTVNDFFRQ